MDNFPYDLFYHILYIFLKWKTIKKCYVTSSQLHVLNKRELCIIKNESKGYIHCIKIGDLHALQRCYTIEKIDTETLFLHGCYYNQLKIIKWLINYAISIDSPIDIHIENECAFRMGIRFDDYKFIKWLLRSFDGFDTSGFSANQLKIYYKYRQ